MTFSQIINKILKKQEFYDDLAKDHKKEGNKHMAEKFRKKAIEQFDKALKQANKK